MKTPIIEIDPADIARLLDEMSRHGSDGGTGVSRVAYSPEWVDAITTFRTWCDAAGLPSRLDAVGNVWTRLEGSEPGPCVVTGSHTDTQVPGGRYDGTLGWLAGFVAVTSLKRRFGPPRRSIEVVGFCEEESSRFPGNFWGSRAITGELSAEEPDRIIGLDGMSVAEAMREVGLDPMRLHEAKRSDIDCFVELHIEQGPVLESEGLAVGIVDSITGMRHYLVRMQGTANHAGAFPMDLRRDPVVGLAEVVQRLTAHAEQLGRPAVTTIGRVQVTPNGGAIIAEGVEFVIDVRHPLPAAFEALCANVERTVKAVSEARGLDCEWSVIADHEPTLCDAGIVEALADTAEELGLPRRVMHSGAGHDAMQMAKRSRSAMIFVRSRDGRSHTPAEFSTIEDVVRGIEVLAHYLSRVCYE